MKKYLDKPAILFGVGAIIGAVVFKTVVQPRLPMSLGGNA